MEKRESNKISILKINKDFSKMIKWANKKETVIILKNKASSYLLVKCDELEIMPTTDSVELCDINFKFKRF